MTCHIASLLLCLDISGLYIDASLAALDSGVEQYTRDTTTVIVERHGFRQFDSSHVRESYSHEARNPYGRLAIGYEQQFFSQRLFLYGEWFHESSLATGGDRGVNGWRLGLRVYPFGSRR